MPKHKKQKRPVPTQLQRGKIAAKFKKAKPQENVMPPFAHAEPGSLIKKHEGGKY